MMDAVNEIVEKRIVPTIADFVFRRPFLESIRWYYVLPGTRELMLTRFPDFDERWKIDYGYGRGGKPMVVDKVTGKVAHKPNWIFRRAQRKGTPEYQLARLLAP